MEDPLGDHAKANLIGFRKIIVGVLQSKYGGEMVSMMQQEAHKLSSGLQPDISDDQ